MAGNGLKAAEKLEGGTIPYEGHSRLLHFKADPRAGFTGGALFWPEQALMEVRF